MKARGNLDCELSEITTQLRREDGTSHSLRDTVEQQVTIYPRWDSLEEGEGGVFPGQGSCCRGPGPAEEEEGGPE